jgi:hypothetical protein
MLYPDILPDVLVDAATAHRLAHAGDVRAGRRHLLTALETVEALTFCETEARTSLLKSYARALAYFDDIHSGGRTHQLA